DRYRATAAHNTVQLGAREQGEIAGPFLWSRKPTTAIERCELGAHDLVRASHDGFAPARHVRTLIRLGDALAVIDELHHAPPSLPIIARWHLAPDAEIVDITDGFVIIRAAGATRWLWFGAGDHPLSPHAISTPHAARYLAEQLAPTVEVALPTRAITILSPDAHHRAATARELRAAAL